MAARAGGPEFGEVSRFSVLATRDSESSEEGAVEHADIDVKKKTRNAKKRARKKKKVAADSAATAEVHFLCTLTVIVFVQEVLATVCFN